MKNLFSILFLITIFLFLTSLTANSQFSREVHKILDLDKEGVLEIDTYKGSIKINTWDKPQVSIDAVIDADGRSREDREMVEETEIQIRSTSSNRVVVRTDYGRRRDTHFSFFGLFGDESGNLPFVHYEINMPTTAKLKIKDYKSDTKISNLLSSLRLNTYKGSVVLENVQGKIDIETYKGDVRVDFAKYLDNCNFETYKGRVELLIPKNSGFRLDADLGKRSEFSCDFDIAEKRKSRSKEYIRGVVNEGGPDLTIQTTKGDIRIYEK